MHHPAFYASHLDTSRHFHCDLPQRLGTQGTCLLKDCNLVFCLLSRGVYITDCGLKEWVVRNFSLLSSVKDTTNKLISLYMYWSCFFPHSSVLFYFVLIDFPVRYCTGYARLALLSGLLSDVCAGETLTWSKPYPDGFFYMSTLVKPSSQRCGLKA